MIIIKSKRENEIKKMLCNCDTCLDIEKYFDALQSYGKKLKHQENFKRVLEFFNALGNEERLKIIEILKQKERCVCELEAALDKSQASISHHLRILENAGLIRGWKKGKFTYYQIEKVNFKNYLVLINANLNFLE